MYEFIIICSVTVIVIAIISIQVHANRKLIHEIKNLREDIQQLETAFSAEREAIITRDCYVAKIINEALERIPGKDVSTTSGITAIQTAINYLTNTENKVLTCAKCGAIGTHKCPLLNCPLPPIN